MPGREVVVEQHHLDALGTAASSAGATAGLDGVIAMPLTPGVTIDWMRSIWPWSSVALLPGAKTMTLAAWLASHFLAPTSS